MPDVSKERWQELCELLYVAPGTEDRKARIVRGKLGLDDLVAESVTNQFGN